MTESHTVSAAACCRPQKWPPCCSEASAETLSALIFPEIPVNPSRVYSGEGQAEALVNEVALQVSRLPLLLQRSAETVATADGSATMTSSGTMWPALS